MIRILSLVPVLTTGSVLFPILHELPKKLLKDWDFVGILNANGICDA